MHICHFFPILLGQSERNLEASLHSNIISAGSGATMYEYRVYLLNEHGHNQVPRLIRCATDEDAESRALLLQQRQAVEVWQEARLVIKIAPSK